MLTVNQTIKVMKLERFLREPINIRSKRIYHASPIVYGKRKQIVVLGPYTREQVQKAVDVMCSKKIKKITHSTVQPVLDNLFGIARPVKIKI
ncbi:hypothetical protein CCP1ISM_930003 [Azospirillaceae bacterium]